MASSDPRTDRLAALSPERRALLERRMRGLTGGSAPAPGAIPRRGPGEHVPLSFAQRRLWFLDQLAPGNPFYNIPLNIRLTIPVNVPALQRAVNEIVRRHEALRTTFGSRDGEPVQVVVDHVDVSLPVVDIRHLSQAEREDEARRLATLEAQLPFDLARGPLVRTTLVQLGDADFLFLLSIHHIVADGWSMGVFSRELSALYSSFALGWPASLPDLPIQYGDFAVWQRQWLTGAVLDEQLGYWAKTLADLPPLQLHTDRPRPPMQAFRGAYHAISLDRELSDGLRALGRAHGVTTFMTLTAGFVALLHRYTAQTDVVIGTPIANRTRRELEPIIGFFVNSLVLRTDLAGDPSFAELLARVRHVALGAYAHQDLPFEALVEQLQPARDPSRNPLFQVTFQLFTPQAEGSVAEGAAGTPIAIQRGTAIFDIAFTLIDAGGSLSGGFEYDTDLFDASTIERMAGHLVQLLTAAVASPGCRVSALPLLTPPEREQLLVGWNATAVPFDERLLDELVSDALASERDADAIVSSDERVSRQDLQRRATALAGWLQQQGLSRGDLVALMLDRSVDMVVAMLAALEAGAAYLPLDPAYPPQRLEFMLRDSRARVVIAADRAAAALQRGDLTVVAVSEARRAAMSDDHPLREVEGRSLDDLAYVIYTSGSTGQPKGVAIPHRAICNHMHWMQQRFPLGPSDRVLQRTPFSFDASVWEFYAPLMSGAPLVLAHPAGSKDPASLLDDIREHGVTVLQLVPSLLEMLLGMPGFDRSLPLRRVFCGGEPLTPLLVQRFHARSDATLCNLYGPTEAAIDSTYWVSPGAPAPAVVPIGRPIANAETYVLDAHGEPVPIGVPGELYIGGAGLARGYLHRPDLTAERFVADPFRPGPGRRLYKTGDLARYRADGQIECLGRLDAQVKLRGYRIELGEIESALRQHPSVRDALVVCRGDQEDDRRLAAYVVTSADGAAAPEAGSVQVDRWRTVFDDTHHHHEPVDPRFNIVGWNSSYTGLPIPAEEMRETVDATLARLRALGGRRVLEVGCGTGLLLLSLAPHCEAYVGTDFSQVTLDGLEPVVRQAGLSHVRLLCQAADEVTGLGPERFDLVILNSVVQYFPDAGYLVRVLRGLLPHVAPGGAIFVGDVRHLALLDALHASVEVAQAPADLPVSALRQRIDRRAAQEQELVLAPDFFGALAADVPGIARVDTLLKRGRCHNELTRFRYDAVIHVGDRAERRSPAFLEEWPESGLDAVALRARLEASPDGVIGFADVPNARVTEAVGIVQALERAGDAWTAARIAGEAARRRGVDPEVFHEIAASVGGTAHVQWSMSCRPDAVDVVLASAPDAPPAFPRRPAPRGGCAAYANDPLQGAFVRNLAPELRRHLQSLLPDFMLPATFTLLERVPLGPNGKVDRARLPSPEPARARQGAYIAPRSPIEERLARLWSEVLAVPQIGVRDNFFTELGGHSLLGTQLVARVRSAFDIDLPLARLFAAPTIAELAVHVQDALAAREGTDGPTGAGDDALLVPVGSDELSAVDLALITRAMQADQGDQAV